MKLSLKTKLLLFTVGPCLTISLLLGGLFLQQYFANLDRTFNVYNDMVIQKFLPMAQASMATPTPYQKGQLQNIVNQLLEESDMRTVEFYDAHQILLTRAGPALPTPQDAPFSLKPYIFSENHTLISIIPVYTNQAKTPLGWVRLSITKINLDLKKYQLAFMTILIILCTFTIHLLLMIKINQLISKTLSKFSSAIQRIKEGQLYTRISISSDADLKLLEENINQMADTLEKDQETLKQNIHQTAEDLRETLETIEIQNIELDLARKEALEASRIKSEFLANMSHEIRTPLNSIIGFSNILLKGELTKQQFEYLDTISKSSEGLLSIINDILDFSKIEAGKLILENTRFNLRSVIEEVLIMVSPLTQEKNLELVAIIYSDVPVHLTGDQLRLKQVLTNLVNNAIKFTEKGNIILRAVTEQHQQGEILLKISITDTGIGLSPEQQKNIFSAFSQADTSTTRRFGGTGLGLVISKHLVEHMGGNIGLESEPGKGSTFWFTASLMLDQSPQKDDALALLEYKKVILFDKNPLLRLSIHHLLDSWKIQTVEVDSLEALKQQITEGKTTLSPFDICLMGSFETFSSERLELLNYLENTLDCRCILLLNSQQAFSLPHHFEEAISNYVTKPIAHNKLYATFIKALYPEVWQHKSASLMNSTPSRDDMPTVLAVDDNSSNLKLLCALLADLHVNTLSFTSGQQVINYLENNKPASLILMDVQMPHMNGVEATQHIRNMEHHTNIPIIAVTAHAMEDEKKALLTAGMNDYITKPINEMQLKNIIQQWTGCSTKTSSHATALSALMGSHTNTPQKKKPIDLTESLKLANHKKDLAQDLLVMLLEALPQDKSDIQTAWEDEDYNLLLEKVHKLHGGTRYCGVPELREKTQIIETIIKKKQFSLLPEALKDLFNAIDETQAWVQIHYPNLNFYTLHETE